MFYILYQIFTSNIFLNLFNPKSKESLILTGIVTNVKYATSAVSWRIVPMDGLKPITNNGILLGLPSAPRNLFLNY